MQSNLMDLKFNEWKHYQREFLRNQKEKCQKLSDALKLQPVSQKHGKSRISNFWRKRQNRGKNTQYSSNKNKNKNASALSNSKSLHARKILSKLKRVQGDNEKLKSSIETLSRAKTSEWLKVHSELSKRMSKNQSKINSKKGYSTFLRLSMCLDHMDKLYTVLQNTYTHPADGDDKVAAADIIMSLKYIGVSEVDLHVIDTYIQSLTFSKQARITRETFLKILKERPIYSKKLFWQADDLWIRIGSRDVHFLPFTNKHSYACPLDLFIVALGRKVCMKEMQTMFGYAGTAALHRTHNKKEKRSRIRRVPALARMMRAKRRNTLSLAAQLASHFQH